MASRTTELDLSIHLVTEMLRPYGKRVVERARKQLKVLVSICVGLAAIGLASTLIEPPPTILPAASNLQVMSWNILARPYTKYNFQHHRASGSDTNSVENKDQTVSRYTIAGEAILKQSCDIVLLQECEYEFTDEEWNNAAPRLLENYSFFRCPKDAEGGPGTAVLVRQDGQAVQLVDPGDHTCIGGSDETGGGSKVATVVPVQVLSWEILAISGHFAFDGLALKRLQHVEMISEYVGDKSIVLGGDFNSQPGTFLEEMEEQSSMFGGLKRAVLPEGSMTGLSGDFSRQVCIDHIYTSKDISHVRAFPMGIPASPWAGLEGPQTHPANVTGASDHVPIYLELKLDDVRSRR
eukprot:TRINITY_DN6266_c0_g1_i1.p1 TRINITY_DN6266_c0_g1~~TRINITY_DN6266_c0_g1_i1.p1  ORF type:complete len:351 (+),score=24.00 TRINITY_DN6266_c0_g1_i1:59-1111(+)